MQQGEFNYRDRAPRDVIVTMPEMPREDDTRFPWGYFIAALCPLALIGTLFVLPAVLGPTDSMAPAMLCALLIGPVGALVLAWGLFRLWRGDAERFPALQWLVWVTAMVGALGLVLG